MEFMTLVKSARSVRRFTQTPISMTTLVTLIDFARYSPSGANQQKLKFMAINDPMTMGLIFPLIKWAGALAEWEGPSLQERPTAYIIILLDKEVGQSPGVDHGIAAQSIVLGARSMGLGTCMIGAYNKAALIDKLDLPSSIEPLLILPLGEPAEEIIIDEQAPGQSLKYYRDDEDRHHVPKRPLQEIIWYKSH